MPGKTFEQPDLLTVTRIIRILQYASYMRKLRVTVTVDEDLLEEANAAVGDGRARSVSEWVAGAMAQRQVRERRLAVLGELIRDYEVAHGVITEEEMAEQAQRDRDAAAVSRMAVRRAG